MRRLLCAALLASMVFAGTASAAEVSARRALNSVLPDLRFDNITVADAIEFLQDVSGANIHVNWRALEAIGVGRDATINVRLRKVTLRKVLTLVLREASSGNFLAFYIDGNVIEVTTQELADQQLVTRIYPVDDLIMEIPDFVGPDFNLSQGSTTGGGGGGQSVLSNSGNDDRNQGTTRAQRAQNLIDTIQAILKPDTWNVNGGPSAIRFFNGSLIVTAPRSVHEALGGYID